MKIGKISCLVSKNVIYICFNNKVLVTCVSPAMEMDQLSHGDYITVVLEQKSSNQHEYFPQQPFYRIDQPIDHDAYESCEQKPGF